MRIARAVIDGSPRIVVKDAASARVAPADHADDALAAIASVGPAPRLPGRRSTRHPWISTAPVAGAGKIDRRRPQLRRSHQRDRLHPARAARSPSRSTPRRSPARTTTSSCPTTSHQQVDYEAELTLLIGRRCGGTTPATLDDVAAYTVANDVSARDVQFGDVQWTRGKSFDTFTPLGPWLVTADEFGDPAGHRIYTAVNGETLQDDSTSELIFDIPALLAFITDGVTLEPGDLILTGTPAGAGAFRTPPRYLQPWRRSSSAASRASASCATA